MIEEMLKEIKEVYQDSNFIFKKEFNKNIILFNNRKYNFDDKFLDNIINIAMKHLEENEVNNLVIIYDYLEEI